MYIRNISEKIAYVGVNDRTTLRFEALWPLPNGVSYNSYLVKGSEKTALIDTVELGHSREFMEALKNEWGIDKIDYLVINHMEPDHSGSIPAVIDANPDLKIVGNKKTIDMIGGFYHIYDPERFIEIKDGETLSLGDLTLEFILTPMVHWPETMMTYCREEKTIFTGDAFGTFGALNGGLIDDEMDCSLYFDEIYRYYSNIVGKYGRFVVAALGKIASLEINYICSTHGPVWHSKIAEVTEIVSRLARYESEPGVTIIYGSMYGNTADMAELFAMELNKRGVKKIKIHNAATTELSYMISDAFRYSGLIIGGPTYSNGLFPPIVQFIDAIKTREIRNKTVAAFGGYSWAPFATKTIAARLGEMPLHDAGSVAMKQAMTPEIENEIKEIADRFADMLKHE